MLLKKGSNQVTKQFNIRIVPKRDFQSICIDQWKILAMESVHRNPFFEHWNLIPALKYLNSSKVYIVTVYFKKELVSLFPVQLSSFFGLKRISIWKHLHCYFTEPLIKPNINLEYAIEHVARLFRSQLFCAAHCRTDFITHRNIEGDYSFLHPNEKRKVIIKKLYRAAYNIKDAVDAWPNHLTGKKRRENKRIINKIQNLYHVEYSDTDVNLISDLASFCEMEQQGWKGKNKSAIYSNPSDINYFTEIINNSFDKKRLSFQKLNLDNKLVSASFRYHSGTDAFEIKTTFDETLRSLNPGVALETFNLNALKLSNFRVIDSCADPNNALINRLWPHRTPIVNLFWFSQTYGGGAVRKLFKRYYQFKQNSSSCQS